VAGFVMLDQSVTHACEHLLNPKGALDRAIHAASPVVSSRRSAGRVPCKSGRNIQVRRSM
jgi:hypothetical protein